MTYSSGNLIQASDYNGFVSSTNAVWNSLYGQTALGTVSTGGTVSATQWATLCSAVTNAALHQGTTNPGFATPSTGQTVSIISALSSTVSGLSTLSYNAYATGSRYTGWTGTNYQSATTKGTTLYGDWTLTFTNTVTFASVASANHFFNAGGLIRLDMSKTSTGQPNDSQWNSFISTIGTLYLSSTGAAKTISGATYNGTTRVGGSGTPTTLASSTGFAQLTGTPTVIFEISPTSYNYTSDYVQITAAWNSSTFQLTFTTTWYQQSHSIYGSAQTIISGGSATSGSTFGTAPAVLCTYYPPESTYLTNTWGTPTVAATVIGFNNGEDFELDISTGAGTTVAQITLFPNASISKYVTGSFSTLGPTAWASPLTGGIGSSYEFRVVMSYLYLAQEAGPVDFPTFTVAGVSYPSATTTPWYTISSYRLIEAYSGYGECNSTGTIEIRNISTLATISRAYTMSASGGPP